MNAILLAISLAALGCASATETKLEENGLSVSEVCRIRSLYIGQPTGVAGLAYSLHPEPGVTRLLEKRFTRELPEIKLVESPELADATLLFVTTNERVCVDCGEQAKDQWFAALFLQSDATLPPSLVSEGKSSYGTPIAAFVGLFKDWYRARPCQGAGPN